eukprot:gene3913-13984_t
MVDHSGPGEGSVGRVDKQEVGGYQAAVVHPGGRAKAADGEYAAALPSIQERHDQELDEVDTVHTDECDAFVGARESELEALVAKHHEQQLQMDIRHTEQVESFRAGANERKPKIKWSSQLLNLRNIEQNLVRQKEWVKAKYVKSEADALESYEMVMQDEAWVVKICIEERKLMQQQAKEVNGVSRRMETARHEFTLQQNGAMELRQDRATELPQQNRAMELRQQDRAMELR